MLGRKIDAEKQLWEGQIRKNASLQFLGRRYFTSLALLSCTERTVPVGRKSLESLQCKYKIYIITSIFKLRIGAPDFGRTWLIKSDLQIKQFKISICLRYKRIFILQEGFIASLFFNSSFLYYIPNDLINVIMMNALGSFTYYIKPRIFPVQTSKMFQQMSL